MRIPPPKLLLSLPNLRYLLSDYGTAIRGQTSVNELLPSMKSFGRCTHEGLTNSHQRAVDLIKMHRLTASDRVLREQLDK